MLKIKSLFLGLISLAFVSYMQAMVVRVDTLRMPNNANVTFLATNHGLKGNHKGQIKEVLNFVDARAKNNEPTHVMVEQPSGLTDLLGCDDQVLSRLPKKIQKRGRSGCKLTTYEDLEVRHKANAAYTILICPGLTSHKNEIIDNKQKKLSDLTFQDIFNEFTELKKKYSRKYKKQKCNHTTGIYKNSVGEAKKYYKQFDKAIKKKKIDPKLGILDYVKNLNLTEMISLGGILRETFSPFFDLHAIHTILTSPHKNMVVAAGFWHTDQIRGALSRLKAMSLYPIRYEISAEDKAVSVVDIRQGLSAQKQSLMKRYAPAIAMRSLMAMVMCYMLWATIIQVA